MPTRPWVVDSRTMHVFSSDTVPRTTGYPEAYLGNKVQNQMGKSCCFGGQMDFESSGDSES